MNKAEGLKKVRFYDTFFWIFLFSLFLGVLALLLNKSETLAYIFLIIALVSNVVIFWGMIINLYKRQYWGLFFLIIILTLLLGIGSIIAMIVYFVKIRKELKEGKPIPKKEKEEYDFWGNKKK